MIVGKEAEKHPDMIQRMHAAGHDIANHSYSHPKMMTLSDTELLEEIEKASDVIQRLTGQRTRYFRPPGGQYHRALLDLCEASGLTLVLWSLNAMDYTHHYPKYREYGVHDLGYNGRLKPATLIAEDVISGVRGGSIVLFHNGGAHTIASLSNILAYIQKKGLRCVTLSELLEDTHPFSIASFSHAQK